MPKKILLADDSITIQKVVELTFSDGDYEVTAVNNGARAVQKLSEMRPDIILSDIIMPEKNGYEVCEFVKSHPEYRHIPVVLLTGTFEPFDPDRADKAGCDAVVTKPFESQSLIHKVEELIEQSRAATPAPPAAAAAAPAAAPMGGDEPSPWVDDVPTAPRPAAPASFSFAPSSEPPASDAFSHGSDIFRAGDSAPKPTAEMPFAPPADSPFAEPPAVPAGETRAFPRMSFDELQKSAETPAPPIPPSVPPAPWEQASSTPSGSMSFEDVERMASTSAPPPADQDTDADSPFGASPPAETFSGETRAFPRMSFDELKSAASSSTPAAPPTPPPAPPASSSSSLWDEQPPATGGETKAFPRMSFDDLQKQMSAPAPAPAEEPSSASLWDETPAASAPAWSSSPQKEDDAFGKEEPAWSPAPVAAPAASTAAPSTSSSAPSSSSNNGSELTDDQIDRIARRVVQLMSDQVVRNIAWEVIPDLAEMVVKERIRQLETE